MVIQVLYNSLEHKERVHVNKRVARVDVFDTHATVITQDGEAFTGDFVVGADGVHSTVRKEMRRIANDLAPQYFLGDEESSQCITSSMSSVRHDKLMNRNSVALQRCR